MERIKDEVMENRTIEKHLPEISSESGLILPELAERFIHKLRNPLGVITTGTSLLNDSNIIRQCEEDRSILQSVVEAADRMTAILEQLALIASPTPPHIDAVAVEILCRMAVDRVKKNCRDNCRVEFVFDFARNLPRCQCNSGQVQIALENMIQAVIQNRRGVRAITIQAGADDEYVFVTLWDRDADVIQTILGQPAPAPLLVMEEDSLSLAIAGRMLQINRGRLCADSETKGALAKAALPRYAHQEDI